MQINPASTEERRRPSGLKIWWVAIRPFSMTASTMSVLFGTALAVTIGGADLDLLLFLAAFLGMAVLHMGGNLFNDAFDYWQGIDRRVNPVSGAVVRRWITPRQALAAGAILFLFGSAIGLWIAAVVGPSIFWIGIVGVAIGIAYTWGPLPLKYHALGDLAVFMNFGILGALGAWTVQTGTVSWIPALWAVPMSLLVVGILHANNWRDIHSDSHLGIHTVASVLGDVSSEKYYTFLLLGPFVLVLLLIGVSWGAPLKPKMPLTFLITLLAMPLALKLLQQGKNRAKTSRARDFLALDGATAQLNLLFGILCIAALALHAIL